MNKNEDLQLEHRREGSGLRVKGTFIPFLKEGDTIDVIMCIPKGWNPLEEAGLIVPGSQTGHCDRCGCEIWLAPSTREVMKQHPNAPTRCIDCMKKELLELKKKEGQEG